MSLLTFPVRNLQKNHRVRILDQCRYRAAWSIIRSRHQAVLHGGCLISVYTYVPHMCFMFLYKYSRLCKTVWMYSSKSRLGVKAQDSVSLLYVFGGPLWLLSWLEVRFLLWFHLGVCDYDQQRMCVRYRSSFEQWRWLLFVVFLWVSDLRWRWGEGSEIVLPCSKQNNLCVIISMLIVCWGSVIPRSGLRVFCVGWGKDVDEETSSCMCVCSCATLFTGTSGSSVPGNLTMSLKDLSEARRDTVCMGWY